jgi:hypothetical protein
LAKPVLDTKWTSWQADNVDCSLHRPPVLLCRGSKYRQSNNLLAVAVPAVAANFLYHTQTRPESKPKNKNHFVLAIGTDSIMVWLVNVLKDKFEAATERVVQAKIALASAEAERDLIFNQIAGMNKVISLSATVRPLKLPKGQAGTLLALLRNEPSKEWTYEELEKKLPEITKQSLRSYLFKLRRKGFVSSTGRGSWKAK